MTVRGASVGAGALAGFVAEFLSGFRAGFAALFGGRRAAGAVGVPAPPAGAGGLAGGLERKFGPSRFGPAKFGPSKFDPAGRARPSPFGRRAAQRVAEPERAAAVCAVYVGIRPGASAPRPHCGGAANDLLPSTNSRNDLG